ncbi:phage tail tape measure protein [Stutzerimonas xanthomarina]|uniref:phage tail tape measure protein n=1 Tax=Stutzerimonas xanthomarina TaxID=271420 RepID=UPI003AA940DB
MSVRSLGQLTLDLVLKTGNFMQPMERAARNLRTRTQEMKGTLLAVGKAITTVGTLASAGAIGLAAMSKVASDNASQIRTMANVSQASVEEFQRLAYGSKSVGIESEKLADIFKDVNDRIGDFVQTGGGPMADFFENIGPLVGVTAEEFRNLSGPQALQLYYDSLEKANLSQKDMTFYLEAMASDTTALIPLLKDGGAGFKEMADEANRANAVLSTLEIQRLEDLGKEFQKFEQQLTTETSRAVSQFDDMMKSSLEGISYALNGVARGFNLFMDDLRADENKRSLEGINAELGRVFDNKARLEQRIDMFGADSPQAQDSIAALEEVKDQYDALITRKIELESASGDAFTVPPIIETDRVDDDQDNDGAAKKADRLGKSITDQILMLQRQADTLGMAEDAVKLYELAQDGATDTQLAAASAALETIAAYEASEQSAEDYQKLLDDLRTTEEQLTDQLHERLAVLDAVNVASDEYAETAARIAEAAFIDAPEFGGLDASIGGAFGELNKIDEAEEKLQEWYDTQLGMLDEYRKERADLSAQWDEQERALHEEHQSELMRIEQARMLAQMAGAESLFGDLSDISKQFAGEQSGIYRAMFAAEKAFAVASAVISIQQGIAAAAALPFPANIPAMASVASATAGIVSTIQGTELMGQAHDGMDYVPETGTYLLKKGEKVTTADTSAKLDATLARVENQINRPGTSGGNVSVHLHEDASRAGQVNERTAPDGTRIIDVLVANIMGDGKAHKALTTKYGLSTRATN